MEQPQFASSNSESSKVGIDIRAEFYKLLPFWFWFVAFTAISLMGAYIYLRYVPNVYATSAKIKILDNSNSAFKMPSDNFFFLGRSKLNLDNEVEVLKSTLVSDGVVKELGLMTSYYSSGKFIKSEMWKSSPLRVEWIGSDASINSFATSFSIVVNPSGLKIKELGSQKILFNRVYPYKNIKFRIVPVVPIQHLLGLELQVVKSPLQAVSSSLANSIIVENVGKSSEVLKLGLTGTNSEKIADIVNCLLRRFNADGIADRELSSKNTINFVNERMVYLVRELDSIENSMVAYKKKEKMLDLPSDVSFATSKKTTVDTKLFDLENQISLSKYLEDYVKPEASFMLLPLDIGISNSKINEQVSKYNQFFLERDKLLVSGGPNNPAVTLVTGKMLDLKATILESIRVYKQELMTSLVNINGEQSQNETLFGTIPEKEKIIRSILRQQGIKESLYLLLLKKREEAAINLAITAPSIKVVEFANSNSGPISPNRNLIYLIALILGILIPFSLLYIRFLMDNKIHTKQDLQNLAPNISVLAEIPFIEEELKYVVEHDRSMLAESYRYLRTNISYLLPPKPPGIGHVIISTSSVKGEGKTFNALNTALILTQMKKKVLLIGADLRNPQLHRYFDFKKEELGLSTYLYKTSMSYQSIVRRGVFENPNLDLITSGPIPPNPSELLSNGRFDQLIREAQHDYDYIIVDSAPCLLVTDTLLISHLSDLVMYIVRSDVTENKLIEFSKELLSSGKIKHMAYVINSIGSMSAYGYKYRYRYNYAYRYNYNYGYGYGYNEDKAGSDSKNSKNSSFLKKIWTTIKEKI